MRPVNALGRPPVELANALGRARRPAWEERGQAIVLVVLALTGVLAAAGVGVDAALLFVEHRRQQVAADAAAFAAAVEMAKHHDAPDRATRARSAALGYAASNGYNNDGVTNTVTVNVPPAAGAFAANADYAEVLIAADVRTVFLRLLGSGFAAREVRARAVGGITGPAKPYAIVALSKTANPALEVNGQVEVHVDEAGLLVNSSAAGALHGVGNAQITAVPHGTDVVGGTNLTPQVQIVGPLTTGAPQVSDPLAYLEPPATTTPGSMTPGSSCLNTSHGAYPSILATTGTCTLNPGVYEGLSVSGTAQVKLRTGVYVIRGGGIGVTGQGRLEDEVLGDAEGVFVYNACSNYPASGGVCGGIMTAGNGRIDLDKPTTGTYAGVSIWQPCENASTMSVTGRSSGPSSHKFEVAGSVYLPCAEAHISGGGQDEGLLRIRNGQLVANTIRATGKARVHVDWESASGTGTRIPSIVE